MKFYSFSNSEGNTAFRGIMDGDIDFNQVTFGNSYIIFSNFTGEGAGDLLIFLGEEDTEHRITEGRGNGAISGEVVIIIFSHIVFYYISF